MIIRREKSLRSYCLLQLILATRFAKHAYFELEYKYMKWPSDTHYKVARQSGSWPFFEINRGHFGHFF